MTAHVPPASRSATWPAPAKLNLFLHITGRRPDGYHLLQTVFQFVDLCDRLHIETRDDAVIRRAGEIPGVSPEQDLCVRAARLLQRSADLPLGAEIQVEKRIPMGAGLGGGSSDAATVLHALNRLWHLHWPIEALAELGLQLGADVPVFVHGRAAWAEGVGERLTPLTLPEPWYLIVVPPVHVSTAAVFGAPDLTRAGPRFTIDGFLSGDQGVNVCEAVVARHYPLVAQALDWLARFGPARMTGTGAGVFAAFDERRAAAQASAELPAGWRGFVVQGRNRSPLLDRLDVHCA